MRAFRIAYDGRPYRGFQRQPDVPTVEGALFDALADLGACPADGPPGGYAAAGRTDAGVSAVAQTVAFDAPAWLAPTVLNGGLPEAVRAWASADVADGFHATHDALAREYTYFLHAPTGDLDLARDALRALRGRHDFHNLTPADERTVRNLSASVVRDGEYLVCVFRASGFVHELVRRLVTVVEGVATGEWGTERLDRLLGPEPVDGPAGVAPAPAFPLVLTDVEYGDGATFESDPDAAADVRETFEARRVERATGARVARELRDARERSR